MRKSDFIISLAVGEATALYFVFGLKEIFSFLPVWVLPIAFPILAIVCLWIAYLIGRKIKVIWQIAKYLLTGVYATLIDLVILGILTVVFNTEIALINVGFKCVSFVTATTAKYFGNKYWAFDERNKERTTTEFATFFLVTFVGLAINAAVFYFVAYKIGVQYDLSFQTWKNISAIIAAFISFAWNFIGYKFIVFKQ